MVVVDGQHLPVAVVHAQLVGPQHHRVEAVHVLGELQVVARVRVGDHHPGHGHGVLAVQLLERGAEEAERRVILAVRGDRRRRALAQHPELERRVADGGAVDGQHRVAVLQRRDAVVDDGRGLAGHDVLLVAAPDDGGRRARLDGGLHGAVPEERLLNEPAEQPEVGVGEPERALGDGGRHVEQLHLWPAAEQQRLRVRMEAGERVAQLADGRHRRRDARVAGLAARRHLHRQVALLADAHHADQRPHARYEAVQDGGALVDHEQRLGSSLAQQLADLLGPLVAVHLLVVTQRHVERPLRSVPRLQPVLQTLQDGVRGLLDVDRAAPDDEAVADEPAERGVLPALFADRHHVHVREQQVGAQLGPRAAHSQQQAQLVHRLHSHQLRRAEHSRKTCRRTETARCECFRPVYRDGEMNIQPIVQGW